MTEEAVTPAAVRAVETAPVTVAESPAAKVRCYGAGVAPRGLRAAQKAVFSVDASQASVKDAPVNVTTTNISTGLYTRHEFVLCLYQLWNIAYRYHYERLRVMMI